MSKEQIRQQLIAKGYTFDEPPIDEGESSDKEQIRQQLIAQGYTFKEPKAKAVESETRLGRAGRSLARGAKNAAAGLLEIPDLLAIPIRVGLNLGAKAIGSDYEFKPLSEGVAHGIDTATEGYTADRNDSERIQSAITRSLVSLPVGVMLGQGLKAATNVAKSTSLTQGLGNALVGSNALTRGNLATTAGTSGLMQNELNVNPDDPVKAMLMGALGGIGGGATAGATSYLRAPGRQALKGIVGEKLGHTLGVKPNKVEDFVEAGVNPMLADVSDSKALKAATHGLEHIPGSGTPIIRAKAAQKQSILEGLGVTDSLERKEAGALAAKGANAYKEAKNTTHHPMFEQIEADIERMPDANIKPTKTFEFYNKLVAKNKNGMMDKKFLATPVGQTLNDLKKAATIYKGEIPYEQLKSTLEEINDKITTHGLIGKSSQGKLKKLADTISDDMERSLEHKFKALGGNAYSNWKAAKMSYRDYATNDIPNLNQMFKKDKIGIVNVFEDMVTNNKQGGAKANLAMSGLNPKEQVELATAYQKRLGSQDDGKFSIAKWGTTFGKLGKDAQDVALAPLNKETQHKVHAIANVVDHIKDTLAEANSSKTAYHATLFGIVSSGLKAGSAVLSGSFLPAASLGSGLLLGRLGANALTNPKIINWIYQSMRSKDFSHFLRNLDRLEHMGGIHRTMKTEIQRFSNDINKIANEEQKAEAG